MKKSFVLILLASLFLVGLLGTTAFGQCEAYGSRGKNFRVHQKAHYYKQKKSKKAHRKFSMRRHF